MNSTEREIIFETDKKWSRLATEGKDIDAIVSYWSDDAVLFPPGMPAIAGKAAIRQYVQESLKIPGFVIGWETTAVTVSEDGKMAYTMGTNHVSFKDAKGEQAVVNGRAVTVWRKQTTGEWKCVVDIWNEG